MQFARIDSRLGRVTAVALGGLIAACVRPALPEACPSVAEGDLVVTELRGQQSSGSYRQWIELYNASDEPIDLGGIAVRFEPLDGGEGARFLVRDADLVLDPGDYVVLGGGDPGRYDYIDYDYTGDYHSSTDSKEARDLPSGGFIDVYSCDLRVDRVLVRGLPASGTLFWPGPPSAADNDDGTAWCVDDFTVENTGTGVKGTPGAANPDCPTGGKA